MDPEVVALLVGCPMMGSAFLMARFGGRTVHGRRRSNNEVRLVAFLLGVCALPELAVGAGAGGSWTSEKVWDASLVAAPVVLIGTLVYVWRTDLIIGTLVYVWHADLRGWRGVLLAVSLSGLFALLVAVIGLWRYEKLELIALDGSYYLYTVGFMVLPAAGLFGSIFYVWRKEGKREPPQTAADRRFLAFPIALEELYSDVSVIGSGGFARVFRAKRRSDGTEVAVKIPISLDFSTGRTFVREIGAWQNLRHSNIVRLHDLNVLPIPYIEMELCDSSLADLSTPLDVEKAASIMFDICEGVKHAHSKQIVHRDLTPQNILLLNGAPKISDWGLSKSAAASRSSAIQSFAPLYAAPEQVAPQQFGKSEHRTDIYQLGIIFYELTTGAPPFCGDSMVEIMAQIMNVEPRPPSETNPATGAVETIIMKCLRKEMSQRYQSVDEMQRALADYLKLEYKDSLTKSQGDMKRSGYYCAELCLVHLKIGDLGEALKYATDLKSYASDRVRSHLGDLASELEYRMQHNMDATEELLDRAANILHQARMGH